MDLEFPKETYMVHEIHNIIEEYFEDLEITSLINKKELIEELLERFTI